MTIAQSHLRQIASLSRQNTDRWQASCLKLGLLCSELLIFCAVHFLQWHDVIASILGVTT